MRGFNRLSRLFLTGGVLAASALCLSSCGNYALFKIHVTTSAKSSVTPSSGGAGNGSVRTDISECDMTIKDEKGDFVLQGYLLKGTTSSTGCGNPVTQTDIGIFSYSTSRTGGTLTFQVDGFDANHVNILQSGHSEQIAPQPYPPEMPEIPILMKDPTTN